MLTLYIADAERGVSMKNLSPKEAITILESMRIDIPLPKAAVTQMKRNLALDMAINALNCSDIPNNSDTISRQAAIDEVVAWLKDRMSDKKNGKPLTDRIKDLPSAQPDVIRCKDCKWWDKYSDTRGYCLAAKHGYWSEHWDISIRRTYDADWYCADAERREQKLQYADEETAQSGLMSAT